MAVYNVYGSGSIEEWSPSLTWRKTSPKIIVEAGLTKIGSKTKERNLMKTKGEFMEQQDSLAGAVDFSTMLHALTQPQAFPFALPGDAAIQIVQTHASAVLLVADRVYKLKKPHNL